MARGWRPCFVPFFLSRFCLVFFVPFLRRFFVSFLPRFFASFFVSFFCLVLSRFFFVSFLSRFLSRFCFVFLSRFCLVFVTFCLSRFFVSFLSRFFFHGERMQAECAQRARSSTPKHPATSTPHHRYASTCRALQICNGPSMGELAHRWPPPPFRGPRSARASPHLHTWVPSLAVHLARSRPHVYPRGPRPLMSRDGGTAPRLTPGLIEMFGVSLSSSPGVHARIPGASTPNCYHDTKIPNPAIQLARARTPPSAAPHEP